MSGDQIRFTALPYPCANDSFYNRVTPNLFKDLLPLSKGEKVFRQNFGSVLPYRDQHGRRHFLIIAGNWDPSEVSFDEAWSALYKTIELISLEPKTQAGEWNRRTQARCGDRRELMAQQVAGVALKQMSPHRVASLKGGWLQRDN